MRSPVYVRFGCTFTAEHILYAKCAPPYNGFGSFFVGRTWRLCEVLGKVSFVNDPYRCWGIFYTKQKAVCHMSDIPLVILAVYCRHDESVDKLAVADTCVYHKLGIHGNRRKAGDGVDLVEYEFSLGSVEEVYS